MTEKLIEAFEQDNRIIQLKQTKEAIKKDDDLMQLIAEFNREKKLYEETGYLRKQLKDLKVKLYRHKLIQIYKEQEKQCNKAIEQLNKELSSLIHEDKNCIKKSHKK